MPEGIKNLQKNHKSLHIFTCQIDAKLDKNKFIICIGDVSGKGMPAALLMSNFQASLRTILRYTDNLENIIINNEA